jgi:hypothetical protein
MRLHVGERFPGTGPPAQPGGYVVTGVVHETPWSGLYQGKKVFYNFDFTDKRPREADEREWLDVLLRTIQYPRLDDPAYIRGRRELARAEVRRILGRSASNLWPEPVDLLEIHNTRDPLQLPTAPTDKTQADQLEPICIFARPQGEPLGRWQQTRPPRPAVLAVLAELLSFLHAVHADGLVLNGLCPDAVLVDAAGRVHYIDTDMVVETRSAATLDWGRLFPPERYPRGFSAPECFDPAAPRDRRADFYAWATLAYFLLTGINPIRFAQPQGRPWARFQEPELSLLEKALRGLAPVQVRAWAEQLGVAAEVLLKGWPHNFLTVFRECVAVDPRQRPTSAADLRAWLRMPPPAPVAAVVALRLPGAQVRLLFDLAGLEPGAQLLVRRGIGVQPLDAAEGELVSEGPPLRWLDDKLPGDTALYYGVFSRVRRDGEVASSVLTPAQPFEPTPTNLRRFAEAAAAVGAGQEPEPEPAQITLMFEALDQTRVAEALLSSRLPQVRGWAIRRLGALWRADPGAAAVETLLWRALGDPMLPLRVQAAAGLIQGVTCQGPGTKDQGPDLRPFVRRVVEGLGGDLDEALQAARLLPQLGVSRDLVRQTVAELEAERPTTCPACGQEVASKDRAEHLKAAHDYVDVQGTLLPRPAALERLWEQVFVASDARAHEELLALLDTSKKTGELHGTADESPYAAALKAQLRARADSLFQARAQEVTRLVRCLRQNPKAIRHFPGLLRDGDPRVRELVRELLLPDLGGALAGAQVRPDDIRRELDRLCPDDLVEERILLCRQLPYLGVDAVAVKECQGRLQAERPVACSECGQRLPGGQLEAHLRQAHRVYQFREARRSLPEMVACLLEALCRASPDHEAWATLQAIACEEHQGRADGMLASWLAQQLSAPAGDARQQAAEPMAAAIAASAAGQRFIPLLAAVARDAASRPAALHLALTLSARLPAPVDAATLQAVTPLLGSRQVPVEARLAAVAALLETTGKSGPAVRPLLRAFAAGTSRESAIRRLNQLEQHVGQLPAIDELCRELEDQIVMRCTRCPAELPRAQMIPHLWAEHRLVLEGRRVREPWRLIEDWLEDYRLERDPAVLTRCQELVSRLDPDAGPARLQRLLLRHGIDDPEARTALLARARQKGASICPHCYAGVSLQDTLPPAPVEMHEGDLAWEGYGVYASDRWLLPWLTIETPDGVLRDGLQPEWRRTRAGLVAVLAVVLLLLMLGLMIFAVPLALLAGVVLATALALGGLLYLVWPAPPLLQDRAVDAAWTLLAPHLLENLTRQGTAFLAGLARISAGRGSVEKRAEILADACEALDEATRAEPARARHLGALRRLLMEDLAAQKEDVVALLLEQAEPCLAGKAPLGLLDELLAFEEAPWAKAGSRARLRAGLCVRAFEAGLECADLIDLGRAYPALGAALTVEDPDSLAQLRLLWWLRQARPWQKLGDAKTVFELLEDRKAGGKRLEQCPEVLLAVEGSPPLFMGTCGVLLEGTWITELPASVDVVAQRGKHGGYHLVVGPSIFPFRESPDELARRLERWLHYYFGDFLPQAASARRWRKPGTLAALGAGNGVACPECRCRILPCIGEMALLLEEPQQASPLAAG